MGVGDKRSFLEEIFHSWKHPNFILAARSEQNNFSMENNNGDFKRKIRKSFEIFFCQILHNNSSGIVGPKKIQRILKIIAFILIVVIRPIFFSENVDENIFFHIWSNILVKLSGWISRYNFGSWR